MEYIAFFRGCQLTSAMEYDDVGNRGVGDRTLGRAKERERIAPVFGGMAIGQVVVQATARFGGGRPSSSGDRLPRSSGEVGALLVPRSQASPWQCLQVEHALWRRRHCRLGGRRRWKPFGKRLVRGNQQHDAGVGLVPTYCTIARDESIDRSGKHRHKRLCANAKRIESVLQTQKMRL